MVQLETQQAQHLAGLIGRYFDNLSECALEYDDEPKAGDFVQMCRDFQPEPDEMQKAAEIDGQIIAIARDILGF